MASDKEIEEAYENLQKKEEKIQGSILNKLPRNTKLIFFAATGILIWAIYTERISKNSGLLFLLLIGAAIYFSVSSENKMSIISEQECAIKLYQQLRYKQLHALGDDYQISPSIRIRVQPQGKLRYIYTATGGQPRDWVFGVTFYYPETGLTKHFATNCDPYFGRLIGMMELPGGFSDLDKKDLSIIQDYKAYSEKKYHDYMGKYWDGKK